MTDLQLKARMTAARTAILKVPALARRELLDELAAACDVKIAAENEPEVVRSAEDVISELVNYDLEPEQMKPLCERYGLVDLDDFNADMRNAIAALRAGDVEEADLILFRTFPEVSRDAQALVTTAQTLFALRPCS